MDLRHLTAFVVVAEELSFSRAAERLYVGQPSLSRTIKQLGVRLLDRSTHHVSITGPGQAFFVEACAALDRVEAAKRSAQDAAVELQAASSRSVRIGLSESAEGFVQRVLASLDDPEIPAVLVSSVADDEQADLVQNATIDAAFGRLEHRHPDLTSEILEHEDLVALVCRSHPLADAGSVALADLGDDTILLLAREQCGPAVSRLRRTWELAGHDFEAIREADSLGEIGLLVSACGGVGILPASTVGRFDREHVVALDLDEAPSLPITVTWRQEDESPGLARLLELAGRPESDNLTGALS